MSRRRIRPFLAIASAAVVACTSDPLTLCACSPMVPYSVLSGRVLGPGGTAVPGASIYLAVGEAGCPAVLHQMNLPVEANGDFRLEVFPASTTAEQCVRVAALPPLGYALRGSDTVQLAIATPRTFPPDTQRVDLVLRAP